tara:strand:+ start:78 stop:1013 length:936 start_codon:yes stop_codon:yes gene_type:complete
MSFKNIDYNAHLRFDDDNPFKNAFDEARANAKARAEEAYDKKKEEFLDDFFTNLREQMNPPENVKMIIGEGSNARLNKGFYQLMNLTPEVILAAAKKEAVKYGLSSKAIKRSDILNQELTSLKNESVKRHYMALNAYRINNGQNQLNNLLKREGTKFAEFYSMFTDPYVETPLHQGDYTLAGVHKQTGFKKEWQSNYENLGYTFNDEGKLTNIPGFWDTNWLGHAMPDGGYEIQYDEAGSPYVVGQGDNIFGRDTFKKWTFGEVAKGEDGRYRHYLPTPDDPNPNIKKSEEIMKRIKEEEEARQKKIQGGT